MNTNKFDVHCRALAVMVKVTVNVAILSLRHVVPPHIRIDGASYIKV
jgi:hypothetical protein